MAMTPEQVQQMLAQQEPAEDAGFLLPAEALEPEVDDYEYEVDGGEESWQILLRYIQMDNIAEELDDDVLGNLGAKVRREYDIDKASRAEWEDRMDKAMDLAMQVAGEKSYPWPGAANVKYPLLTVAATEFAARAYPALVSGADVVKAKVNGEDEDGSKQDRAQRVSAHMSWQLTDEMEDWEEDTDRLLHVLPIMGVAFKKTYYAPMLGRNVSELVHAKHFVVNYHAKDMRLRTTEELELYPFEITERMRSGMYLEQELGIAADSDGDDDAAHMLLEQHRLEDLDGDGYPEPYIVTVHKETGKVLRVVARYDENSVTIDGEGRVITIKAVEYYTKYPFMRAPDGSFYEMGLGVLLGPLSETINTTINQLMDAGTLANVGGGFIGKGLRMKSGPVRFKPGEYMPVNNTGGSIRENIVPMQSPGPSPVLFQLLGMLIDAGRDIANTKDIMDAAQQGSNMPATTTMALIEQGMVQYSAIFKRLHRAMKKELDKLYRLNALYLPPQVYFTFHDQQAAVAQQDYAQGDLDIQPVTDPTVANQSQKLARAQFLMGFMNDPMVNPMEVRKRIFEAANIDDLQSLLVEPQPQGPPPELIIKQQEMLNKRFELMIKAKEAEDAGLKDWADAMYALARAESEETGANLAVYNAELQAYLAQRQSQEVSDGMGRGPAGAQGMAQPSGYAEF